MASTYLAQRISASSGEVADKWTEIETLFSRKLWHQLTVLLEEFVNHSCFASGGLVELYDNFLKELADRINKSCFVNLSLCVTRQIEDKQAALKFLEGVRDKAEDDAEAKVRVQTEIAAMHVRLGDMDTAKTLLEECEQALDGMDGVTAMHADFYKVQADYFKIKGDFDAYYTSALRYLGCIDTDQLSDLEKATRAFDLGLSALVGKNVYNFGELLAHEVLNALRDTDKQWLVDLLFAFNAGDLAAFDKLRSSWQTQRDLADCEAALTEKIQLLSLMEMVFKAPAHSRSLKFADIAATSRLKEEQVEHLVMRALSLGLVKGSIDQVESVANLNWVQPRVLDINQLAAMKAKMDSWVALVDKTSQMVENTSPELFEQQY